MCIDQTSIPLVACSRLLRAHQPLEQHIQWLVLGRPSLPLQDAVDRLGRHGNHHCLAQHRELDKVHVLCVTDLLCSTPGMVYKPKVGVLHSVPCHAHSVQQASAVTEYNMFQRCCNAVAITVCSCSGNGVVHYTRASGAVVTAKRQTRAR